MSDFIHGLAHKFGWAKGTVETWWNDGILMVGFKCSKCGEILHATESATNHMNDPEYFGLPPYPHGVVTGSCVCGSWPGGKCLRCPVRIK